MNPHPYSEMNFPKIGTHACHCVGPQPGMPRCPCQMRGLIKRDGRWVQPEQDLGPVMEPLDAEFAKIWDGNTDELYES